jgi:hypothetical protein
LPIGKRSKYTREFFLREVSDEMPKDYGALCSCMLLRLRHLPTGVPEGGCYTGGQADHSRDRTVRVGDTGRSQVDSGGPLELLNR